MSLEMAELLARLATTIRGDIAPAVDEEFAKTQAFMASVILQRLAKQAELGPAHAEAEAADLEALADELAPLIADAPVPVRDATEALASSKQIDALAPLIEAIYSWSTDHNDAAAPGEALAVCRRALRADIDRRMEIAK